MLEIIQYSDMYRATWDELIHQADIKSIIFYRSYMDYNANACKEISILIREKKTGECVALFPMSSIGGQISSYGCLTFGGTLFKKGMSNRKKLMILSLVDNYLVQNYSSRKTIIKITPAIYGNVSENLELNYWLTNNFVLKSADISSYLTVQDYDFNSLSKGRKSEIKKAKKSDVKFLMDKNFDASSYELLCKHLAEKYKKAPVHSQMELQSLVQKNSGKIRFARTTIGAEVSSMAVIYIQGDFAHFQYLSSSTKGRSIGALDFMVHEILLVLGSQGVSIVNFGTSNYFDDDYYKLNEGMFNWKSSFGGDCFNQFILEK